MSHKIEKPMSETTIKDQPEKEKRHREDSPTPDDAQDHAKRRELSPPGRKDLVSTTDAAPADHPTSETISADTTSNETAATLTDGKAPAEKTNHSGSIKEPPKKFGFGQAKGFASLSGSASAFGASSNTSTFSSLFSKSGQDTAFSSLLNNAPSSSIFSQETAADSSQKEKHSDEAGHAENDDTDADPIQNDDQYVVVKGLEKTTVPTGEEDETCIHLIRAKLFAIDPRNTEAGWKERGVGNLRVLRNSKRRTRLVMRADAVLRVILNMPLHPKYKLEDGGPSMGEKTLRLFGVEDGVGSWLAIRVGNQKAAEELKEVIQKGMDETPVTHEEQIPDTKKQEATPVEHKVSGIVLHHSDASDGSEVKDLDSVEATEIQNEKAILAEKAQLETVDLAKSE